MTLFMYADGRELDILPSDLRTPEGGLAHCIALEDPDDGTKSIFHRESVRGHASGRIISLFVERTAVRDLRFRTRLASCLGKKYPFVPEPVALPPLPFTPNIGPKAG